MKVESIKNEALWVKNRQYKLLQYYYTTRGVGHTTLMMEGTKNYDGEFFLIGGDLSHSELLGKSCRSAKPIIPEMLKLGAKIPIAVDHYAVLKLLQQTLHLIEYIEEL